MNPDDLTRLLPAPAERDLPRGRHEVLRARVLAGIGADVPKRRRTPAWVVPVLAVATAAVVGLVTVSMHHSTAPASAVAVPVPHAPTNPRAVTLLAQVASAAGKQSTPVVRDDQFEYVETKEGATTGPGAAPADIRQSWLPVADLCRHGLLREGGQDADLSERGQPGVTCPYGGDLNYPSYRLLAGLPTDPQTLLATIYLQEQGHGSDPDSQAFTTIGDLLRDSVPPPAVSAALYRAAALIPGVQVESDAVDAAGRHGIAVSRSSQATRYEWIFDRTSLVMIGEREVRTKASKIGAPGTIMDNTAILAKAIVDSVGATR
ncbi:MAG TPA: CU044_5270 family protein [Pseudonocardiaceae bacterium]|nr:CU044_5270 family protein [Pseudonocardiaceae bacterium]